MATFILSFGVTSANASQMTRKDVNLYFMQDRTIDLSSSANVALTSSQNNNYFTNLATIASGDTIQVMPIPDYALTLNAGMEVIRAATANTNGTVTIQLSSPATTLLSATAVSTVGVTMASPSNTPTSLGTAYTVPIAQKVRNTAGSTVTSVVGTAVPDAQYRIFMGFVDYSQRTQRVN